MNSNKYILKLYKKEVNTKTLTFSSLKWAIQLGIAHLMNGKEFDATIKVIYKDGTRSVEKPMKDFVRIQDI